MGKQLVVLCVVSCQLSIVGCQLSVVGCRLSVLRCRLSDRRGIASPISDARVASPRSLACSGGRARRPNRSIKAHRNLRILRVLLFHCTRAGLSPLDHVLGRAESK